MAPAILTSAGEVVYGRGWWKPGAISQELANSQGVVGYPRSIGEARRAGPNPLVAVALSVSGPPLSILKTDVVISDEDAVRIRAANSTGKFLERMMVDIVTLK